MVHGVHSSNNKQQQQQQTMKPTEGTRRVRTHAVLLLSVKCALHRRNSRLNYNIDLSTPKPHHPYTKFEHFGIIRFELCCGQTDRQTNRQTNRQTDRQTEPNTLPSPTDRG